MSRRGVRNMSRATCMVMVLAPWRMPPARSVGERRAQNALPINAVVPEKAVVLGGEEGLDELRRQLVVAHRDAPLLADGGDQPPIAGVDPQRHLQLDVPQAVDIRQRRASNRHKRRHWRRRSARSPPTRTDTNARYEN